MAEHNELGRWGEEKAAEYLERKGFRVLERDWKTGHRDIDIVAIDSDVLVIIEVKTRRNKVFMEPELAVDWKKIHSLTLAANAYIRTHRVDFPVRFDIITVVGTGEDNCQINHIEDAFRPA